MKQRKNRLRKNRLDLEHRMFYCSEQTSALSIPKLYRFFNGFFQIPVTPTEISIHGKAVLGPTRFGDFSSCLLSMTYISKQRASLFCNVLGKQLHETIRSYPSQCLSGNVRSIGPTEICLVMEYRL
jgi:hypothetical protein